MARRSTTGSSSAMSPGAPCGSAARPARRPRRRSRTRRAAEAKRGAAPRSWSRRLSSSMYCATESSARSRRAIARGPAPTISTSSVCASSGNCSSAARNASADDAHAHARRRVDAALAGRAHRAEDHLDRRVEQGDDAVLLVVEVLVERRLRHAGLAGDRLGGRLARSRRGRTRRRRPRTGGGAAGPGGPRAAGRDGRAGRRERAAARRKGSHAAGHYPLPRCADSRPRPQRSSLAALALAGCTAQPRRTSAERLPGRREGRSREVVDGLHRPGSRSDAGGDLLASPAPSELVGRARGRRRATASTRSTQAIERRRRLRPRGERRHGHGHHGDAPRSARARTAPTRDVRARSAGRRLARRPRSARASR